MCNIETENGDDHHSIRDTPVSKYDLSEGGAMGFPCGRNLPSLEDHEVFLIVDELATISVLEFFDPESATSEDK